MESEGTNLKKHYVDVDEQTHILLTEIAALKNHAVPAMSWDVISHVSTHECQ